MRMGLGGMGLTRKGTRAAPIVPTTGILAFNRFKYMTNAVIMTAPFTSVRYHCAHPDGDVSNIKTVDLNRYWSSSSIASPGAVHSIKRYFEYPVGSGTFYPVLWSGGATLAMTSGGRHKSDAVAGLVVAAGTWIAERTVLTTSATVPVNVLGGGTSTALGLLDGNLAGDWGNTGLIPATADISFLGCQAMEGTVNATNARAFVVPGDSLVWGTGDSDSVGAKGGSGWIPRMLDAHGYPYFTWGTGGQQVTEQAAAVATLNADLGQFGFTDLIMQTGINDLRLGRTKAQIEADYQTIYAASNITGKRIYQCTIGPRSTSTDSWATTANQTAQTDGNMADLTGLNTDIRAGLANVTGVLELADAAMSARNSNIHKAPPAGTTDGTHYNSTRAALIASLLSI